MGLRARLCEELRVEKVEKKREERRKDCRSTVVFGMFIPFVLIAHKMIVAKYVPIIANSCFRLLC